MSKQIKPAQARGLKQLPDGRWRISYCHKGRWIRKILPNKAAAQRVIAGIRGQLVENRYLNKREEIKTPFAEAVARFLEWGETNLRPSTFINDKRNARTWLASRFLSGKTLDQITAADVERFKQDRAKNGVCHNRPRHEGRPLSKRAVDIEVARLKRFFSIAMRLGLTDSNPAARVELFREDKKSTRWLNPEEEGRLLAVATLRMHRLIRFAIYTGMRKGEILNLRWSDVDLKNRVIIIPGERAKAARDRHIYLNATTLSVLDEIPRPIDRSTLVFGNELGKVDTNLGRDWRAVLKRSGIEHCRWHDLRHTYGSRLAMAGVPIMEIMKLMGHNSIAMTLRYAHLAPSKLQESVCMLDANPQKTNNGRKSIGAA